jgi:DNA invertase Pin-like site-specific DNA recombinase
MAAPVHRVPGYAVLPTVAEADPAIAAQWLIPVETRKQHWTPKDTTIGSHLLVRWQCVDNPEHIWEAKVQARRRTGPYCPLCAGRRMLKRLTRDESREIVRRYRTWEPVNIIAKEFGISAQRVTVLFKQSRLEKASSPMGYYRAKEAELEQAGILDEILNRYREGEWARPLAQEYTVSSMFITWAAKRHGITAIASGPLGELPSNKQKRLITQFERGTHMRLLCDEYKVPQHTIYIYMRAKGITRTPVKTLKRRSALKRRPLSVQQEILDKINEGEGFTQLAREYDANLSGLYRFAEKNGIVVSEIESVRLTEEAKDEIIRRFSQGEDPDSLIGEYTRLGFTTSIVRRFVTLIVADEALSVSGTTN